jgi:hypothetical protein
MRRKLKSFSTIIFCTFLLLVSAGVWAEEPKKMDETELAKAAQNPIANMISIPIQANLNFRYGPDKDKMQSVTKIQPVIPISLNKEWNLITRTIVPVIYTEFPAHQAGLGDVQFTGFLSPSNSGKFIWGVGPVVQFPTHTDTYLGSDKWAGGPSAVGLFMEKNSPWVFGLLVQNIWSFAGPTTTRDNPAVNQFLAQPFINYNLPKGWYITFSPMITADWKAAGPDQWTVPLGLGAGKIFKIGKLPFKGQLAAFYNVARPSIGPDWSVRAELSLLLPKAIFGN